MAKASYKAAGVDIEKAEDFVKSIKSSVASTMTPGAMTRKGAFGGLFALEKGDYREPVLVSSTDGVGTKLLIANELGHHDKVGIDLVAMNVNDILCVGAKPLFFLDYIACGRLDPKVLKPVVRGIVVGCRQAGCALIGGETAEMPGMYKPQDYDLAGFAVGVVEKSKIIDGTAIKKEDQIIGLSSSGIHSNGYSLVRKVLSRQERKQLARTLLSPTKIYVKPVLELLEKIKVNGMAHITGGAYYEKLTKILPKGFAFRIRKSSWSVPKIFKILQTKGKIADEEMYRTFNMGIGFALVVNPRQTDDVLNFFKKKNMRAKVIGDVVANDRNKVIFE